MDKLFRETQGKKSSSGTRRREMVRCTLTLSGDKCEVGGGVIVVVRLGSVESLWDLRAFPLVLLSCLPVKSKKCKL